jgi:aspartate aminotransferase
LKHNGASPCDARRRHHAGATNAEEEHQMPTRLQEDFDRYITPNVKGLAPSATVAINDRSNALRAQGRDVFKLGLGQSPFPVPEVVVDALRENAHTKDYLNVKGLYDLRRTIAERHCRTFDIEATAEDVLIGPGSKELMFLLQLCYDGDIVIPSPAWVSYEPQARIVGRPIYRLHCSIENDWFPTAEEIDLLCRNNGSGHRILILNYPLNPTGTTLSRDRMKEIAEVARENRILILSDEIYGKLDHDGIHNSIVPLYPEGTIFSGGLSKWCGAGGWRLGLFVFPPGLRWLQDAMAAVGTETFTSTCAPVQHAAITAFEEGEEIAHYLVHARRVLGALGRRLATRIRETGAEILDPAGAFYLFPDFSPIADRIQSRGAMTSAGMCERLLEDTGVAVLPGSDFGRPPEEFTMRIAYVDFDGAAALAASEEVPIEHALPDDFAEKNCGRVVEAVERLCRWMEGGR